MDLTESVEALWRIEAPQLIATLARRIGDLDIAEDLASEAFVAALEQWPVEGLPPRPGAWSMRTAWHKAIDPLRREETARRKAPLLVAGQDDELPDVSARRSHRSWTTCSRCSSRPATRCSHPSPGSH